MAYKNLLVVVDNGANAAERLRIGAALAERFEAHLAALYVAPLSNPASPDAGMRARALFEETAGARIPRAEWRTAHGFPTDVAAVHARYADLVILGQIDPTDRTAAIDSPRPEDVALSAGRPVLVIPYVGKFRSLGQRVLCGWNASREATRALNDALPLLRTADSVTVMTIDPLISREAHGEVPGADIALHLSRHRVRVSTEATVSGGIGVGNVLLSRASDLAADLLVMGAYGHSRLRELVLGGATRIVLESMTLPVLMSH
jgi:nucleotide-binding universal stress UspA family protein